MQMSIRRVFSGEGLAAQLASVARIVTRTSGGIGWVASDEGPEVFSQMEAWFEARLRSNLVKVYVADAGTPGSPVIVGSVQRVDKDRVHSRAAQYRSAVERLFVLPEHGTKGIGRQLMLQLIADARRDQLQQLELDVRKAPGQTRADALYRSLDFKALCTIPNYAVVDGQVYEGVLMALDLRS